MKKFVLILLSICILALPSGAYAADEEPDFRVVAVCAAGDVQVGDQFLVRVMIDGEHNGYLTYSVAGTFDTELAELIAPVYKDDGFTVVYNDFSNEDGTFQFDAADFSLNGSNDNLLCSLLFKAKAEGNFKLSFGRPGDENELMVGRLGSSSMYDLETVDMELPISGDITRDSAVIIEERKPVTPYNDMAGYSWAEIAVGALGRLGIMDGIAGESFEPDKKVTRGEFVAMLIRGAKLTGGGDNFPDVALDYPFAEEISVAKRKGIALGGDGGLFNPDAIVTRQDISAFVYRALSYLDKMDEAPLETLADFPDSDEISDYALPAMASVVRARLLRGDEGGNLNPGEYMTRAEAAVLVERVIVHIKLVL